jgi:hypothetical protein
MRFKELAAEDRAVWSSANWGAVAWSVGVSYILAKGARGSTGVGEVLALLGREAPSGLAVGPLEGAACAGAGVGFGEKKEVKDMVKTPKD